LFDNSLNNERTVRQKLALQIGGKHSYGGCRLLDMQHLGGFGYKANKLRVLGEHLRNGNETLL
jgi:hypothetical protein